jgi:Tol biopolymer transport system component/DNA-binding winged helix-turn-helix (wHTH) protein
MKDMVVLRFFDFELDPARFELRRGGEAVRIEPRVLEVLLFLASRRDRVVTKEELIEGIWGVKFISESALTRCIHEARRALGDDGPQPTVIKTVHGRGYRFIATARECEVAASRPPEPVAPPRDAADVSDLAAAAPGADAAAAPLPGAPVPTQSRLPGWRRLPGAMPWLALGVLGATLALVLAGRLARRTEHSTPPGADRPLPALKQLTAGIQDAVKPAYSPEGGSLLFLSQTPEHPGMLDIFLMPAAGGGPRRLTSGVGASGDIPVFTSDGSAIVFSRFRDGEDGSRLPDLWQVSRFGGQPRPYLERASGAGFSAGGDWVAYTGHVHSRTPLWISRTSALGEHRQLAEVGFVPRWSPGDEWIAFTTSDPQGGLGDLWLVSPATGERRRLTDEPRQMYGLVWARDGRSVIFTARRGSFFQLWQVGITGGYTAPLTTGMGEHSSPTVSPDGKTLAFCHSQPLYRLARVEGLASASVTEVGQPEHHLAPRLSPTDWRIASAIRRPDFDEAPYVTDLAAQTQVRLGDHRARQPIWLNGDEIAYLVADPSSSTTEVWVVNSATGMRFAWTKIPGDAWWLAVHPDMTTLAYVSRAPDGAERVVVRGLADHQETTVASGALYECLRWRPGARALSWSGPVDGGDPKGNGIWLASLDGPGPLHLALDGYGPAWSDDGRAVHFARFGGDSGLWRLDVESRRLVKLRTWSGVFAFDTVGDRLFYVQEAGRSQVFSMPLDQ